MKTGNVALSASERRYLVASLRWLKESKTINAETAARS